MSAKTTINIPDTAALPAAAKEFAALMGDETVYAFYGEMGAGKTTFIRELSRALGVEEDLANSPSFHHQRIPLGHHRRTHLSLRPLPARIGGGSA